MNPDVSEKMINRIQALFNKAEGTDNAHERQAFLDKAEALVAQYKLDWATIAMEQHGKGVSLQIDSRTIPFAPNQYVVRMWKLKIATGLAEYHGIKYLIVNRLFVNFIGPKDILDVVVLQFEALCAQVEVECAVKYEGARKAGMIGNGYGQSNGKTWKTACLEAAATVVARRFDQKKRQESADYVTTAIVPVLTDAINDYVADKYPKLSTFHKYTPSSPYSARRAGEDVGRNVDLDRKMKAGHKELKS